jgi:hypothetical protein
MLGPATWDREQERQQPRRKERREMISPEFGLNIPLMAYRVEEARQQLERREACYGLRPVRPSRLSRSGGRVLSRLGRTLLALGQRLERPGLSQPSLVVYQLQAQRRQ